MIQRFPRIRFAVFLMIAAISFAAFADEPVGRNIGGGSMMDWQLITLRYEKATLTWSCAGEVGALDFPTGRQVSLAIENIGDELADGTCSWELRLTPNVSKDLANKLKAARAANDNAAARRHLKDAGINPDALVASGSFTIAGGAFVSTSASEAGGSAARPVISTNAVSNRPGSAPIAVDDQVIPDDLIVQGSGCFGFDCVNNESFGFDTIRLKENNLRIKAEDTSVGSFPTNDWQLTFNDSASGGASKFSVEDITGSKVPMTITAGATTNSIFVDSTGRVGFRTSTPVLDIHINTSNTPAIRLEQNNSGGFTAQTWDIGANEANFFVRDVTSGSRLPFRIRPGAPTSSIDISADGEVGIGGVSSDIAPYTATAQVISSAEFGNFLRLYNSNGTYEMGGVWMPNTARTAGWMFGTNNAGGSTWTYGTGADEDAALTDAKDSGDGITATIVGNVGFNCNNPTSDFVISASSNCSGSQSSINAGATQFTVTSSRTMKENLEPVAVPDLLDRISKIDVYAYDFKTGPKDRLGLMAEDFHGVFGRGSDKVIDGNEVQMALWMAVQQLTEQNKQLQERLNTLEQQLESKQ